MHIAYVFFAVATIAALVFIVGFGAVVYYVIRFVKSAKETGETLRDGLLYRLLSKKKNKNAQDR